MPSPTVFALLRIPAPCVQAALTLAHSQDGKSEFSNKGEIIKGTQEDVDLLVAFKAGETFHLILVEAKAYSGWTNDQLSSKAKRLRTIFGEDGKKWSDVQPYFWAMAPRDPNKSKRLRLECLPKWMLINDGELQWLCLQLPRVARRMVSRFDKTQDPDDKDSDVYQQFEIKSVPAP